MKKAKTSFFLPYQRKWLEDNSQIKIWEKSRRIGATFVQAYEDVRDCITKRVSNVWFSSADESAAREYILYCARFARAFDIAFKAKGKAVLDDDEDVQTFSITFANRSRITAMTSNPKKFRSKGGKLVLDEFSHHQDAKALWTAAEPVAMWGHPIRILSTHNGKQSLFYQIIEQIRAEKNSKNFSAGIAEKSQFSDAQNFKKLAAPRHVFVKKDSNKSLEPNTNRSQQPLIAPMSVHRTDIFNAIDDGLLQRIGTNLSAQNWIAEKRRSCFDEFIWLQEYCCQAIDSATAFIPLDMINLCKDKNSLVSFDELRSINNALYAGFDVGRHRDSSELAIVETDFTQQKIILRYTATMKETPFKQQLQTIENAMEVCRSIAIDKTGIGLGLHEQLLDNWGEVRVTGVQFTTASKEEIAYNVRNLFDKQQLQIPEDYELIAQIHSIQRSITKTGKIKLSSEETKHHADKFWALALACSECPDIAHKPITRFKSLSYKQLRGKYQ